MKQIIFFFLINSIFYSISSNSMFFIWICLEINIMMYTPMLKKKNNFMANALMKYFIIQSMSSMMFLLFMMIQMNLYYNVTISNLMIMLSLWIKLGFFPFSSWYYQMSENLDWNMWFFLNSLQKIIPLWILSWNISSTFIMNLMILINSFYSMCEMFNQTSMRWMMNSSSLNHFSWMLLSINTQKNIWEIYLIIYTLMIFMFYMFISKNNWNTIFNSLNNQSLMNNFYFSIFMMNFIGMPPFLGFFPKIIIMLNSMAYYNMIMLLMNNLFMIIIYFYFNISMISKMFMIKINFLNIKNNMLFLNISCFSFLLNMISFM